jgi:hypothetical protein
MLQWCEPVSARARGCFDDLLQSEIWRSPTSWALDLDLHLVGSEAGQCNWAGIESYRNVALDPPGTAAKAEQGFHREQTDEFGDLWWGEGKRKKEKKCTRCLPSAGLWAKPAVTLQERGADGE